MNTSSLEWFFIINPNAGAKKGGKLWPEIRKILTNEGINFSFQLTDAPGDATTIAIDKIKKGGRYIAVVGGDGTLNETVNGIMAQNQIPSSEITLALIPVGTGNDWGRMYQIPDDPLEAIHLLKQGVPSIQDLCRVSYMKEGKKTSRIFINLAGVGFDAEVVRRTNKSKQAGHGGHLLYLYHLVRALFSYKAVSIQIKMDEAVRHSEFFAISIGMCRYKGGGMITAPHAIPDDGLLDITLIHHISRLEVIRSLPLLFNGKIHTHKKVETFRSSRVKLESATPAFLETDGELVGQTPLEFEIIPLALRFISGKTQKVENS